MEQQGKVVLLKNTGLNVRTYLQKTVPFCPGCLNTFGKIMEKKKSYSVVLDVGWVGHKETFCTSLSIPS